MQNLSNKKNTQKTANKMADSKLKMSIIMLNINGVNTSIKRQRLSNGLKKKKDPTVCCKKSSQ